VITLITKPPDHSPRSFPHYLTAACFEVSARAQMSTAAPHSEPATCFTDRCVLDESKLLLLRAAIHATATRRRCSSLRPQL
jgi:hypothetical protein